MVRPKAPAKKQQKKGIDFKKIKRKLGRKLPPPKNATNTEIKSKAITLREQTVGAEKSGFATSNRGLTLEELMRQVSHTNPKMRKKALHGFENLFEYHPDELQAHKYAIVDKLRERFNDEDGSVRHALYLLFKTKIFPSCKEENEGRIVSRLMPYIYVAMADTAIDIRLMAFKFLDLVVEYYPPTFSLDAEKILENYKDIIQKNHFYVQDKSKLKVALSGLARCLSLLPCDESDTEAQNKGPLENETLLAYEQDAAKESTHFGHVSGRLKEIVGVLIHCFQDFIPLIHALRVFDEESFHCVQDLVCSIGYAIKFSVRSYTQRQATWLPSSEEVTLMIQDQDIASMLSKKLLGSFPLNPENNLSGKDDEKYFTLNSVLTEIFLEVSEWSHLPIDLWNRFLEFIENTLLGKITKIKKPDREKTLLALLPSLPKLILRVDLGWRNKLLQAFTITFSNCKPESPLILACMSIVRDMIIPNGDILYPNASDLTVNYYQTTWVDKLASLLNQLGDKHHLSTQAVLQLLLDLGRVGCLNASPTFKEDVIKFFSPYEGEGDVHGGPFASLPRKVQELALCFLYYHTIDHFSSSLLKSIVSCCLYPQLEPAVLYRTVEILHTAYRAGYIQITDHLSFIVSLIARFKVVPENGQLAMEWNEHETYRGTFKGLTKLVCSCLSEMGDGSLVLQIVEKILIDQIELKPALDNGCAIIRMICELDSKPTGLSESSVNTLIEFLPGYLNDIVTSIPEDKENYDLYKETCLYYLVPCFFLFERIPKLTEQVLKRMRLMVTENTNALELVQDVESGRNSLNLIHCIVSVILLMSNDDKVRKILLSKSEIDLILQDVKSLQSSKSMSLTVEWKNKMKIKGDRLEIASNRLLTH